MSISCLGRCRGDSKLYTLLRVDVPAGNRVVAKGSYGLSSLPCSLVHLQDDQFVLVNPDLDVVQRVDFLLESQDDAAPILTGSLKINAARYAVASKLNGKLRADMCAAIRNIDSSGIHRELAFTCDGFIPKEDGLIVRGEIARPEEGGIVEVVAFDSSANIVGRSSLFLNDGLSAYSDANLKYSVVIPYGLHGLCLAALDGEGRFVNAIKCFNGKAYKDALDLSWSYYANASDDPRYEDWLASHRLTAAEATAQRTLVSESGPLFSVIVPLYKTPLSFFRDMADSVLQQTYPHWELILVNSTPEEAELKSLVDSYASKDERIRVIELDGNLGITGNTNVGIEAASGEYLCFFDHDDTLEPDILFEYARAIASDPQIDLLYCDEDKLFPNGHYAMPTFKPDFSIDMVRDNNYICHLLTVRTEAYRQIEPSGPELDGAQDHAMVLKISELGGHIHHVPKILYHWRISETSTAGNSDSKPYATQAGILAVQQHLDRLGIAAKASNAHGRAFRYRVDYQVDASLKASLVVPTRGDIDVLGCFIEGLQKTSFSNLEIVFVCNDSVSPSVREFVSDCGLQQEISVIAASEQFTLSAYCNLGARKANGNILVFMHDDVIPGEPEWLETMLGFATRPDVGVVGTMTRHADNTIQQAGLSFVRDSIVPLSAGTDACSPGYLFFPLTVRNVFAVDGACFATRKDVFEEVGCFDESLRSSYVSVDYSLALSKLGYLVTYTPEAWLYHRSIARFSDMGRVGISAERIRDKAALLAKWSERLSQGDAYFNRNFSSIPAKASRYQIDHEERLSCR